jgi:zinc transport system ATP-binding protein
MPCHDGCGLCQIKIDDLSVEKGRDKILINVSFLVKCGELTAIIGTNGAGKTTLLRSILGEINHTGKVIHEDCTGENIENITVGYVPQILDFDRTMPISVEDFLLSGRTKTPVWLKKKKSLIEEIRADLDKVGCADLISRKLGSLSGGELQKVLLVAALNPSPDLLILDEPVSGVDEVGTEKFYKMIHKLYHERHIAVAMVSHDLSLVREYADKVVLLNKSVLCYGTVDEVFSSQEFKKEFGGL